MVYAQAGTIPSVCWGIPEAAQQSFETTLAQSSSLICLDKVQLSQCRPLGKARNQAALAGDHWICQTNAAKRNAVKKKLACLPERHPVLQHAPQLSASQNVRISERGDGGLAGHNGICLEDSTKQQLACLFEHHSCTLHCTCQVHRPRQASRLEVGRRLFGTHSY